VELRYEFDRLGARLDNAALLQRAGVIIAFSLDDGHDARTRCSCELHVSAGAPADA
jgi:hypothetical protein